MSNVFKKKLLLKITPKQQHKLDLKAISEIICPVCGYYCLGKGSKGCIEKKIIQGYKK